MSRKSNTGEPPIEARPSLLTVGDEITLFDADNNGFVFAHLSGYAVRVRVCWFRLVFPLFACQDAIQHSGGPGWQRPHAPWTP